MNLGEFINEKTRCPVCIIGKLAISIETNSGVECSIKYEEDRGLFFFDMTSLNKWDISYKACLSFSLKDNSFSVECYDNAVKGFFEGLYVSFLKNFKELNKNIKNTYRFNRRCRHCNKYLGATTFFHLDFKNSTIDDLLLWHEGFTLITPTESDYKIVQMHNYYHSNGESEAYNKSTLLCWRDKDTETYYIGRNFPRSASRIETPLIPFISEEETKERINKLILFS